MQPRLGKEASISWYVEREMYRAEAETYGELFLNQFARSVRPRPLSFPFYFLVCAIFFRHPSFYQYSARSQIGLKFWLVSSAFSFLFLFSFCQRKEAHLLHGT